jgi:hypothetical protein
VEGVGAGLQQYNYKSYWIPEAKQGGNQMIFSNPAGESAYKELNDNFLHRKKAEHV